jgi:tellurium resistance protein TerD
VNAANSGEIARFDLSEDGSVETSLVFGEVYRNGSDWKFKAVGQGYQGGLGALASSFGVKV